LGSDQEMVCLDINVIYRLWSRLRVRGFILESLIKLYILHCVTPASLSKEFCDCRLLTQGMRSQSARWKAYGVHPSICRAHSMGIFRF